VGYPEQPLPVAAGSECACLDPNLQERLVWPQVKPLGAIDRAMDACQSILDEVGATHKAA
jgi:hypothetical protein